MNVKTQTRRPRVSRRKFLALAGLGTGLGVAACAQSPSVSPVPIPTRMPGMETHAPTPAGSDAAAMDAMHKQGIDTFVANVGKDSTFWRQSMAYVTDGAVKVFDLTCTEGKWEIAPGSLVDAMLYNGMVPGPEIRVTEGDAVGYGIMETIIHGEHSDLGLTAANSMI